eukprot:1034306-Pyramimonas_sp.AAC.2
MFSEKGSCLGLRGKPGGCAWTSAGRGVRAAVNVNLQPSHLDLQLKENLRNRAHIRRTRSLVRLFTGVTKWAETAICFAFCRKGEGAF